MFLSQPIVSRMGLLSLKNKKTRLVPLERRWRNLIDCKGNGTDKRMYNRGKQASQSKVKGVDPQMTLGGTKWKLHYLQLFPVT